MSDKSEQLRLVHFGPAYGRADASPFCVKAEAYLRMLGVEYDLVRGTPMKSPRGQLPVLLHRNEVVAGSSEIIDYLRGLHGSHLDDWLTDQQQVQAYHLLKSVEEHLYFLLLYQRWLSPKNFKLVENTFFADLNPIAKFLIARLVRRGARQRCVQQGLGRYSPQEINTLAEEAVTMLSRSLGDQDFFFGDKPCWVDCSMFGFITNLLISEFPDGVGAHTRTHENLVAYEQRFGKQFFSDLSAYSGRE